ncbi:MAG: hypothetical protein JWO59_1438 [Chloroflexi bacterium]|nr:hypothetical protein [Chloroflexota bacterium]
MNLELLHEGYPALIGLLLSPIFLVFRAMSPRSVRAGCSLAPSVAIGACVSALNGELTVGFPDGLLAVAADSMLVYGTALFAYVVFWKRLKRRSSMSVVRSRQQGSGAAG